MCHTYENAHLEKSATLEKIPLTLKNVPHIRKCGTPRKMRYT